MKKVLHPQASLRASRTFRPERGPDSGNAARAGGGATQPAVCLATLAAAWIAGLGQPNAAPAGERLQFAVAPGSSLTKRFETSFHLRILDPEASSAELPGEADRPTYPQETDVTTKELLRVTDRYLECAPAGPLAIERSYLEWKLGDSSGDIAGPEGVGTLLTDCTVRFTRLPDESWRREALTLSDPARDEPGALEKLAAELDFVALLPAAEVSIGSSWDVPVLRVENLVAPGLELRRVLGLDAPSLLASLGELSADALPPVLRCTLASVDRDGERGLATITLALAFHAPLTPTPAAREALGRQIGGGASFDIQSFTHDLELAAHGELVWDLGAGHFHSFELAFAIDLTRAWQATLTHAEESSHLSTRERFHVDLSTRASLE